MANLAVGSLVTTTGAKVPTAQAPGGSQYGQLDATNYAKVIADKSGVSQKNVNGQTYINLDFSGIGGGTGWAPLTGDYINYTPPSPQAPSDVQGYLNTTQQGAEAAVGTGVETTGQILSEVSPLLQPAGARPTAPNLVQQYQDLSTQSGVPALQQSLANLKDQALQLQSQLRLNVSTEQGKQVAQNVISGRISQEQQQTQQQLDWLGVQQSYVTDQLNMAYNNINAIMNFTQQDYANASQQYNDTFNQNLQMINLVRGIQQDQKDDVQRALDNARANVTTYVNLITSNNLSVKDLPADQQLALNQMAVSAGFSPGFIQSIQPDPSKSIISTNTLDDGRVQVLTKNADGSISAAIYGTAANSTSGASGGLTAYQAAQLAQSQQKINQDSYKTLLSTASGALKASSTDKYLDQNEAAKVYATLLASSDSPDQARQAFLDAFNQGQYVKYGNYSL